MDSCCLEARAFNPNFIFCWLQAVEAVESRLISSRGELHLRGDVRQGDSRIRDDGVTLVVHRTLNVAAKLPIAPGGTYKQYQ